MIEIIVSAIVGFVTPAVAFGVKYYKKHIEHNAVIEKIKTLAVEAGLDAEKIKEIVAISKDESSKT
jgi:hypothetical protein